MPRASAEPILPERYRILRELGRGGAGRVFLVRDLRSGEDLALKLIEEPALSAEDLDRVRREFALLSEIEHPGIARARDFGYAGGRPYFTSEFVPGEALSRRLVPLGGDELFELARDLADALSFLHGHGILHLDVKPGNVIVPAARGGRRAVLIDFGLFRRGSERRGPCLRGSLPFMAPECFRGGELEPSADVYAAGVTLYWAATGRFPREGAVRSAARSGDPAAWDPAPRPPSEAGAASIRELDGPILKCLALDPRARFPSGAELLAAVEALGGRRRRPASGGKELTTIVGREAELEAADRLMDAILGRAEGPRVLLLTGPPGAGQSHLLRAIKVRAQTRGLRAHLEVGYPGRPSAAGGLFRAWCAGIPDAEARARWEGFLKGLSKTRRSLRSEVSEGERRLRRAGEVALAVRALAEPTLILVDGLEHWDETSIDLAIHLVRHLGETPAAELPPLGLAIGCREEGRDAELVRELAEYALRPGKAIAIALGPLGLEDCRALYRMRGGSDPAFLSGLALLQRTGGTPARVVELARAGRDSSAESRSSERRDRRSRRGRRNAPEDAAGGLVALVLELLARPARPEEIAPISGLAPSAVRDALERLRASGRASPVEPDSDGGEWALASRAAAPAAAGSAASRRRLHSRIARELVRRASPDDDAALLEAVRHFRAAGEKRQVVAHGLRVAARLKASFQHRAALEAYRAVLQALPPRRRRARLEVTLEIAELHSRIEASGVDEAIGILREALSSSRSLPESDRRRILLRLATLHSRKGDFRRAEALFDEGLRGAVPSRRGRGIGREEFLLYTNERAAMKCMAGEYREALELCGRAFRLAGRSRSPAIREVVLNLHATRANVALRNFDFEGAIRDLETAVDIAEAIGSSANQAAVLNNLGIAYNQCDRYADSIRAFREAERLCLRLDEGPSLASIYGNLAILHAKLGEFSAAEAALRSGERLLPAAIGRRQRFFLFHARGLSLLYRGRPRHAVEPLERAIELGRELGDRHVVAYDEVYLAEALVFLGEYRRAEAALGRLAASPIPRVRAMAAARAAFLDALLGRRERAPAWAEADAAARAGRPIGFLDAWDRLFLGWAFSIAREFGRAQACLRAAGEFFAEKDLLPARCLAAWVEAESFWLRGDLDRARTALDGVLLALRPGASGGAVARSAGDLVAALAPLLDVRLAFDARGGPVDAARCADELAEAAAALAGNELPEWSTRLDALRAFLAPDGVEARRTVEARRRELARDAPPKARGAVLGGEHWTAWARRPRAPLERPRELGRRRGRRTPSSTATVPARAPRSRLVARSPGMRKLVAILDRLRGTDLPVLIRGETGTGKELVARILHEESPRAAGPFSVVDCAAIPESLFEAELFGARGGAFTGIDEDRPGLLAAAEGGTILFDEIAGATPAMQAKLLRVLEARTFRPVGSEEERKADVRFLFTSARDLERELREGRLSRDLYHRMGAIAIEVPPLRDRPEDFEDLVQRILAERASPSPEVEAGAIEALRRLEWPGNVRELANFLERLSIEGSGPITAERVDAARRDPRTATLFPRNILAGETLGRLREKLERDYIAYHFRRLGRDTSALARFLGCTRRHLYRRCARLGISLRKL